jgi:hypothetical protein
MTETEVHFRPLNWGGCHFAIGDVFVRCGSYEVEWWHPTFLGFREPGQEDYQVGIEIAPTAWTSISEVNTDDPRLKWYQFEKDRKPRRIPLQGLWRDSNEGKGTSKNARKTTRNRMAERKRHREHPYLYL